MTVRGQRYKAVITAGKAAIIEALDAATGKFLFAADPGARGGAVMEAQIQLPNVAFFLRLGWLLDGEPAPMLGVPHQPMAIGLTPPGR